MLRRNMLIAVPVLTVAGCQVPASQTISNVVSDVQIIGDGLQGVFAQLGQLSLPALTPSIMSTVGNAITNLQKVAAALGAVNTTAAAQPLVKKIETYVNAVVSALAMLPLPPPISTAIQAAAILLPIIETAVGLAIPQTPKASSMSPAQARMVLLGASASAPK